MLNLLHFGVHAQEEANFEVSTLLKSDCKNILNLLLLHLSTHHNRVLVGVKMLAEMNQTATEQKVLLNQGTNEEIVSCNTKVQCSMLAGMFALQNWHILETVFYHLWWIVIYQLWFDAKIGT